MFKVRQEVLTVSADEVKRLSNEVDRLSERLDKCADLLGYELHRKKKTVTGMYINGHKLDAGYGSDGAKEFGSWEAWEARVDYISRLIAEDEENKRLIKLAEDVEMGNKLRGER